MSHPLSHYFIAAAHKTYEHFIHRHVQSLLVVVDRRRSATTTCSSYFRPSELSNDDVCRVFEYHIKIICLELRHLYISLLRGRNSLQSVFVCFITNLCHMNFYHQSVENFWCTEYVVVDIVYSWSSLLIILRGCHHNLSCADVLLWSLSLTCQCRVVFQCWLSLLYVYCKWWIIL